jgi:hypothetical protein
VSEYVKEYIAREEKEDAKKTFFSEIMAEAMQQYAPGKAMNELSDSDIKKIIADGEVRLCFSGLLAVSNIITIVREGLERLYADDFINAIVRGDFFAKSTEGDWLAAAFDIKKMPWLHAFYLEVLRTALPFEFLPRYAEHAIPELGIPPRSYVILDIKASFKASVTSDFSPAEEFQPARFMDRTKVNLNHDLNQGASFPFAAGDRMCPAVNLATKVFKLFMGEFMSNVDELTNKTFKLREKPVAPVVDQGIAASAAALSTRGMYAVQSAQRSQERENFPVMSLAA